MQEGHVTVDAVEESCILVGVITSEIDEVIANEHLDELEFLAETAGAITQNFYKSCLIRTQEPMLAQEN
jgi:hypothetical protein